MCPLVICLSFHCLPSPRLQSWNFWMWSWRLHVTWNWRCFGWLRSKICFGGNSRKELPCCLRWFRHYRSHRMRWSPWILWDGLSGPYSWETWTRPCTVRMRRFWVVLWGTPAQVSWWGWVKFLVAHWYQEWCRFFRNWWYRSWRSVLTPRHFWGTWQVDCRYFWRTCPDRLFRQRRDQKCRFWRWTWWDHWGWCDGGFYWPQWWTFLIGAVKVWACRWL